MPGEPLAEATQLPSLLSWYLASHAWVVTLAVSLAPNGTSNLKTVSEPHAPSAQQSVLKKFEFSISELKFFHLSWSAHDWSSHFSCTFELSEFQFCHL